MSSPQRIVFKGRIIQVGTQDVILPNGSKLSMEVVTHPGGSAVVAVDDEDRVCLLKQYRPAIESWVWELPAGKIDNREPPLETAQRELQEEAGVVASHWQAMGHMLSSPGVFTEKIYLYLARGLTQIDAAAEEHEVFEVHWLAFADVLYQARSGEISDAKSVVGLFRAADYI